MEVFLCGTAIAGIIVLSLFFYLLNTARKKGNVDKNQFGKKNFAPVYVSIADKPDSIIRGMNNFVREAQKTETAGDKPEKRQFYADHDLQDVVLKRLATPVLPRARAPTSVASDLPDGSPPRTRPMSTVQRHHPLCTADEVPSSSCESQVVATPAQCGCPFAVCP